ncbi:DUF6333 family protein [Streptomyces boluensis]|uniref:Uncharacterized protein n=1 Tax=Streptomyces boluensis TaxID=1775135 RepID=A0A964UUQ2_9ACTN|nr:DUF6333 family protein [Streptomyces boluensis]NBE54553.1 hypothetical protein [Streptomyces boluensis]
MDEKNYWTCPPEAEVRGGGEFTVTLVLPPFTDHAAAWPHNDPVRAREFAASFGTVEEIVAYEGEHTISHGFGLQTRDDLEWIEVGVWDNVIGISDPSLADRGLSWPVLEQVRDLAARFPEARIVGSSSVDRGETHEEVAWAVPGFDVVHSEGWPCNDDPEVWTLEGDPQAVLDACGVTARMAEEADIEFHPDSPADTYWGGLGELILGTNCPWRRRKARTSIFRVRHTHAATDLMEENWLDV